MTILHNTILNQSLVYIMDECPRLVYREEANKLIKEWKPKYEEETCLQCIYMQPFDGPWPLNQEELIEKWNKRFEWMKDLKLVWI